MRKQLDQVLDNQNGEALLHNAQLRQAVSVLRAINHKLRQKMIDMLHENEQMTVTNLYIKLRLEQSVASQHLAILRNSGVVKTERQGKFIYYSIDREHLREINDLVDQLAGMYQK
jgi:DNA-binding transcriptional ArsR family regulator